VPTRKAITISLDPTTWQVVEEAAQHHDGNTSAAIRALIAGDGHTAGHTIAVSDAGWAALQKLADQSGKPVDVVAKLALRHAVQHPARWL
jgi:hypothetical protein